MARKAKLDQTVTRRAPRQARALHKVQLILDAALEILERDDFDALTTNSLAERAGVSIGTVYQYFGDKRSIVDALVTRELAGMSDGVMRAVRQPDAKPGDRVRGMVSAVLDSYRGRKRAHRQLIAHSTQRGGSRLNPMFTALEQMLGASGPASGSSAPRPLAPAEAFVLMHAVGGVLRMLAAQERAPPRKDIEEALTRLVAGFLAPLPIGFN